MTDWISTTENYDDQLLDEIEDIWHTSYYFGANNRGPIGQDSSVWEARPSVGMWLGYPYLIIHG